MKSHKHTPRSQKVYSSRKKKLLSKTFFEQENTLFKEIHDMKLHI
jgi:hypothetical protein